MPLALSILLAIGAVIVIVLLVVGAVMIVRDAMNGCPFALVWLMLDGLGSTWYAVAALGDFVGAVIGDVLTAIANSVGGGD